MFWSLIYRESAHNGQHQTEVRLLPLASVNIESGINIAIHVTLSTLSNNCKLSERKLNMSVCSLQEIREAVLPINKNGWNYPVLVRKKTTQQLESEWQHIFI